MAGEENIDIPANDSVVENDSVENSQSEETEKEEKTKNSQSTGPPSENPACDRLIKLPISRVKHIMKCDPDVSLASQEAVITLAKATELFIGMIAKDSVDSTFQGKRKTLQRKDLDVILDTKDCYAFLDGAIDSTSS